MASVPVVHYNQQTPWRMSDGLYQRARQTKAEGNLSFKRCLVLPSDPEWDFVWQKFYEQKTPSKYMIGKIYCIHQGGHTKTFENELFNLENSAKKPAFQPAWSSKPHAEQRERIIARWKKTTAPYSSLSLPERGASFNKTRVLPLWHGCPSKLKGESICDTGFLIYGKQNIDQATSDGNVKDGGFFGSGIYFTNSVLYAVNVYSEDSGFVLMSWVSTTEPYPITMEDYISQEFEGKGSYEMYNAHYIPVVRFPSKNTTSEGKFTDNLFEKSYFPAVGAKTPDCDELVVFQKGQTLPRFWVELQPNLPFEPSTDPKNGGDLINFIAKILQHDLLKNDQVLQKLLKEKIGEFIILGEETFLAAKEMEFYRNLTDLFPQGTIVVSAREKLLNAAEEEKQRDGQKLSNLLTAVDDLIEKKDHIGAWRKLSFRSSLPDFDLTSPHLYELLRKLLPFIPPSEKDNLLENIVEPLRARTIPSERRAELEESLAKWFDKNKEQKLALECYGRALQFDTTNSSLYEKVSTMLTKPLFGDDIRTIVNIADASAETTRLTEYISTLDLIRNHLCINSKERTVLAKLYHKIETHFEENHRALPDDLKTTVVKGQEETGDDFPSPYAKTCLEALKTWETAFTSQIALTSFPNVLKKLYPEAYNQSIELLLAFLGRSLSEETSSPLFFSPLALFQLFCKDKINLSQFPLIEMAFRQAANCKNQEELPSLIPMIKAAVEHLCKQNVNLAMHEKFYQSLSTKPLLEPLREAYLELLIVAYKDSLSEENIRKAFSLFPSQYGTDFSITLQRDFSNLLINQQKHQLLEESPSKMPSRDTTPTAIIFTNCSVLTAQKLVPFLSYNKLTYLDLSNSSLESIPSEVEQPPLKVLCLRGSSSLTSFKKIEKDKKGKESTTSLYLKYLKALDITDCKQLTSIQLDTHSLEELKADDNLKSQINQMPIFGKEDWNTYFGDVGEEPPLPSNIRDILNAPCPFKDDVRKHQKVSDTHILTLIPATVNGQPLTLQLLGELVRNPKKRGVATKYDGTIPKEAENLLVTKSHWTLMLRDNASRSFNLNYSDQEAYIKTINRTSKLRYWAPPLLDAVVVIFMEYFRSEGKRFLGGETPVYTRCKEIAERGGHRGDHLTVGGCGPSGLNISFSYEGLANYGIAFSHVFE